MSQDLRLDPVAADVGSSADTPLWTRETTTGRDPDRYLAELLGRATLPDTGGKANLQEQAFDGAGRSAEFALPSRMAVSTCVSATAAPSRSSP